MKSRYLALTAATALTICGAPTVNAKTKTVSLKVTTLKPGTKTISGKATPGAKIRVTRYAKTYATGKATRKGTFKLKTKVKLKGGWHYKVRATKKGYQGKVLSRYVAKPKTDQQIVTLQSQINALQQQLAQLGDTSTNKSDMLAQSTDLRNQLAKLKNELAAVQTKVAQSKTSNLSKDTTEPNNEKPTIPFDKKTTEYYIYPYEKIYMYPDMELKGQAEVLTQGTDSGSKMITVQVFGHLPKPKNNQELPSWYNTNYPSSKFGTMLIEANGQKGYVQMDTLKGLAVGDSYYRLTNLPDDLGIGTMSPNEVNFTHLPMDGARWTQITMAGTNGNEKYWYYHADTQTWNNEWKFQDSNSHNDISDNDNNEKEAEHQKAYQERQTKIQELSQQINDLASKINDTEMTIHDYRQYSHDYSDTISYREKDVADAEKELANDPNNQDLQLELKESKSRLESARRDKAAGIAAKEKIGNGIMDWIAKLDKLNAQKDALYNQRNELQTTPY